MNHTILVYGTLRPFKNEELVHVGGKLYDLGWYPGYVPSEDPEIDLEDGYIVCERITVNDERLRQLDMYEGYDEDYPEGSLYLRKKVGEDWIYVYNRSVENYERIESGDWQQHTENLKEGV